MRFLLGTVLLTIITSLASAEIYKWRDKDGNLHYGDRPPADAETKQVEVKVNSYQSVEVIYSPDWFYKREKKTVNKDVIMYSAEWCGICKKAKAYFRDKNISFVEHDIDKSKQAREDFDRLGARGVPVIFVGKRQLNGFSVAQFEAVYYGKQKKKN